MPANLDNQQDPIDGTNILASIENIGNDFNPLANAAHLLSLGRQPDGRLVQGSTCEAQLLNSSGYPTVNNSGITFDLAKELSKPEGAVEIEGYSEEWHDNRTSIIRRFAVRYSLKNSFRLWATGWSDIVRAPDGSVVINQEPNPDGSFTPRASITRTIPAQHPSFPFLYCTRIQQIDSHKGGFPILQSKAVPVIAYAERAPDGINCVDGWAFFELEFSHPGFFILNDVDTAALGRGEISRWVRRAFNYALKSAELYKNGATLKFVSNAATVAEGIALKEIGSRQIFLRPVVTLEYQWVGVPIQAVPYVAIATIMGTTNADSFDMGTAGVRAGPGELLCQAPKIGEPYPGPTGVLLTDLTFRFEYDQGGWNRFPGPSGRRYLATFGGDATGRTLYDQGVFANLFKPEYSNPLNPANSVTIPLEDPD